jgi:hypothetical protein
MRESLHSIKCYELVMRMGQGPNNHPYCLPAAFRPGAAIVLRTFISCFAGGAQIPLPNPAVVLYSALFNRLNSRVLSTGMALWRNAFVYIHRRAFADFVRWTAQPPRRRNETIPALPDLEKHFPETLLHPMKQSYCVRHGFERSSAGDDSGDFRDCRNCFPPIVSFDIKNDFQNTTNIY